MIIKETKQNTPLLSKRTKMSDDFCEEPSCDICVAASVETIEGDFEVTRYPRKFKRKPPREQRYIACILSRINPTASCREFLFCRANDQHSLSLVEKGKTKKLSSMPTGLANLWQFPQDLLSSEILCVPEVSQICQFVKGRFGISNFENLSVKNLGELVHKLSHIYQIFDVWHVDCGGLLQDVTFSVEEFSHRWITEQSMKDIDTSIAISTGSFKMFSMLGKFDAVKKDRQSTNVRTKETHDNSLLSYFSSSAHNDEL